MDNPDPKHTTVLFVEPPPTLDWTPDSTVSKAGRRHPCLNETGEQIYSYQNLSCAAVLREQGYAVRYLHCPTQRFDCAMTREYIDTLAPFAMVIMVEHINALVAEAISRHARGRGVHVIWVGPHVTALHQSEIAKECVDYVLRREWDYAVAELVGALRAGASLDNVAGLTWRQAGGAVAVNEDRPYIEDLDALPVPAYDLVDLSKFYESVFVAFPAATMITSRGCPFNCVFCSYPETIYGHRHRTMSPARVVKEIAHLVDEHGVREIRIDDDTFNIDRSRAMEICRLMVRERIRVLFSVQARPSLMTDELAAWLKKAGCRMVLFGVESGNDEVLARMRKQTTKNDIRRGVRIAKKHGLDVLNCVMLGFYWDTPATVEETMQFAFELNAEFTQVSAPTPLPGTDYYRLLEENGCLLTSAWHEHDSVHHSAVQLPSLTNQQLNEYLRTFYRRYYRRPRYVWMMLVRMFRSWGAFTQSMRKWTVLLTK
ncbi:MAG: radical SAM protein [Chitinivibrionales bacterium]|nr:radical SAM protein [Chitinivibrionales bacterium]MBD3394924.1 radical SAM protein [Chitinivibrionales bacterium]